MNYVRGYSGVRKGTPRAGLRIWKAAANCTLPAAAVHAAGAENTSIPWLTSRILPRPRPPAPYGQLPSAARERLTLLAPPTACWLEERSQPLDSKSQSQAAAGAGIGRPLLPPESGSGSDARDRWGQSWCRWGGEKLPLPLLPGAAEVKAEAGLGWGWD